MLLLPHSRICLLVLYGDPVARANTAGLQKWRDLMKNLLFLSGFSWQALSVWGCVCARARLPFWRPHLVASHYWKVGDFGV